MSVSYAVKSLSQGARELIAFRIGDQEFCVNIMSVREIRGWTQATPMPHAPAYVRGVINLRGAVLPIIDMSARLGMKETEPTPRHVIIVAQVKSKVVGLLVEAVSDILTITDDNIQPVPEVSSDLEKQYARGILAIDKRMICLIELEALFPEKAHDKESEAA
ncbi:MULTISPECIES: chemotaxis protein CheW [Rhizobiaceae]|jgi:purine-binding chemotaxis protein CheW|uniref:Purine-binding chemotaxis protein CheW n=2 Tax=Rhizobiaceae TaxID=82115 RepID=A0A7W6TEW5_9HYPH|nr:MULTISPECIES: chemotaxis protein CheW [Rhizobium]MBB4348701.1 purine-binding chemotaxis protein CheW [Rhizobium cellulosilyticum]MBB4411937.1 purine-binding chemotaxis protein CheW [Rhizobium cellulosilyticum]MBB4449464.1 purine-binding chemotaxis protein CheW [Rhizobium cellulosilyticum]MBB6162782.1 purine-binding chemotaxis protein CheW [Rhizobium wenxiniae]GGF95947.1 chemotaxis protein CheW [Rhizobium wenxiniae]